MRDVTSDLDAFPFGEFRAHYRAIIDSHGGEPFALGPHGRPEFVVMKSARFHELTEAVRQLDEMSRTMPVLLAAVQAGVAFPSETLNDLGYRPAFDAYKLAAFVSQFAEGVTHDEDGQRLFESSITLTHESVEEDDLELTYRDTSPDV